MINTFACEANRCSSRDLLYRRSVSAIATTTNLTSNMVFIRTKCFVDLKSINSLGNLSGLCIAAVAQYCAVADKIVKPRT